MTERFRVTVLILIMAVGSLMVVVTTIWMLYSVAAENVTLDRSEGTCFTVTFAPTKSSPVV